MTFSVVCLPLSEFNSKNRHSSGFWLWVAVILESFVWSLNAAFRFAARPPVDTIGDRILQRTAGDKGLRSPFSFSFFKHMCSFLWAHTACFRSGPRLFAIAHIHKHVTNGWKVERKMENDAGCFMFLFFPKDTKGPEDYCRCNAEPSDDLIPVSWRVTVVIPSAFTLSTITSYRDLLTPRTNTETHQFKSGFLVETTWQSRKRKEDRWREWRAVGMTGGRKPIGSKSTNWVL